MGYTLAIQTLTPVLLSLVIPIRNEQAILWHNASALASALDNIVGAGRWRFILVDNASTDSTPAIITKIIANWPPSFTVYAPEPNYGAALRAGLSRVDTPYAALADVEQWDAPFLAWAWRHRDEYDLFIGSRRADPSLSVRPKYRWLLSWGLNALLQLFFEFTGTETHGPKLIRMANMKTLIAACISDRGQYDTEIVLRAIRASRRIVEVPIASSDHRRPRNLMLNKIVWNILAFNRLRLVLENVPREGPVRYWRFTREDVLADWPAGDEEALEPQGNNEGGFVKVIILGGDGFCGWPTSLHLSERGYDILIVDNLSRRNIDNELEVGSLTPIRPMSERLRAWKELTGHEIRFRNFDVAEHYHRLLTLLKEERPDAVVHFAEQRAAPYSMKSSWHKRYTVDNNVNATNNLLAAIVESGIDTHVVHLGTMGVYGYGTSGTKIPEGYLRVKIDTQDGGEVATEILHPVNPGSIYHLTKTLDQLLFAYYNKNDRIRVTDLHQGIVWGTQIEETRRDDRLVNRFDYDGDYGTVLNRFLMQAAIKYPLTVHGTGGQTRAFINIQDTVRCIELAIATPPNTTERVRIMNQMTETHRVRDLAKLVAQLTGVEIQNVPNPRFEADENELQVENQSLIGLGLTPITLQSGLLLEIKEVAEKYAGNCDRSKIPCVSLWRRSRNQEPHWQGVS